MGARPNTLKPRHVRMRVLRLAGLTITAVGLVVFVGAAIVAAEAGFQVQWLLPTVILLPGAFAIISWAALAKREGERWRNRDND